MVFQSAPKNTNMVVEVRFCFLSCFVDFRSAVAKQKWKMSVNQRPGQSSKFSDWPIKHKLGRGHLDFVCCHVSSNSIQQLQDHYSMSKCTRVNNNIMGKPLFSTDRWTVYPSTTTLAGGKINKQTQYLYSITCNYSNYLIQVIHLIQNIHCDVLMLTTT